jgi:ketosteroid isomerase-like protein
MRPRFIVMAALVFGCSASGTPGSGGNPGEHVSGAGVDRQKEEQAIRGLETSWRKSLSAGDTASIASFYAEDAIYSPQGFPAYRGRDSVSGRWAREFLIPGFRLERTPLRIDIAESGDLANEVGTYAVHFQDHNLVRTGGGSYMTAWRKTNGSWRIASYMWNRNEPESSAMGSRK